MAHLEDRDYALVVGIDDYPRFGQQGRNLSGAIRDARSFAQWLTDRQSGGGLPDDHCKLITSEGDPLALSKTTIDNGLEDIWQEVVANGGGRRLYLFFSGHGQIVDGQGSLRYEQTLCLPNWSLRRLNEAIITDSYQVSAQHCMPFEEIVAFLDCCRVPTVRVRGDNTSVFCPRPQQGHETIKRIVFYAGEPGARVFEGEGALDGDEIADEPIVHGHFTNALLNGLKQGSARPGGGISAKDLMAHLEYWVPRIAERAGHSQQPRSEPLELSDSVVFGKAAPGGDVAAVGEQANISIAFNNWRQGPMELIDASADVVKRGPKSSGPWQVHLRPELYVLRDTGTEEQMSIHYRPEMEGANVSF